MTQNWNLPDNPGQPRQDHFPPHVQQHVPQYHGQPYYTEPQVPPQWQDPQYQPPAPHRRWSYALLGICAVALLAASAGATILLRHHATTAAKPLSCKQQYTAWKAGPAHGLGEKAKGDAKALTASANSGDIKTMLDGLKTLGADASALQAYPIPACADPKGYWAAYLASLKASGDNAGSASGFAGLLLAEAPLKNVKTLQAKMDAELKRTVGNKAS